MLQIINFFQKGSHHIFNMLLNPQHITTIEKFTSEIWGFVGEYNNGSQALLEFEVYIIDKNLRVIMIEPFIFNLNEPAGWWNYTSLIETNNPELDLILQGFETPIFCYIIIEKD